MLKVLARRGKDAQRVISATEEFARPRANPSLNIMRFTMFQAKSTITPLHQRSRRFGLLLMLALVLSSLWVPQPLQGASVAAQTKTAIVGGAGATLVDTPGGQTVAKVPPGTPLVAVGRSADGQWLVVALPSDETRHGWVATTELVVFGITALPVTPVDLTGVTTSASIEVADSTVPEPGTPVTPTITPTATRITETATVSSTATARPATRITPTATPAPPAAITSTATPTATLLAEVIAKGLNVRSGPGVQYGVLTEAKAGDQFPVLGRTARNDWVQIALPTGEPGWISTGFTRLSGPVAELPIVTVAPPANAQPPSNTSATTSVAASIAIVTQPVVEAQSVTDLHGKLVFSTGDGGLFYLYDLASGALRPVTSGSDPALSPDGRQIAFTRGGGEGGLYLINSDGSGERRIFAERAALSSPKWSPDGQWIVFSQLESEYKCRLLGNNDTCVSVDELLSGLPTDLPQEQYEAIKGRILPNFPEDTRPNWTLARVNSNGDEYRDIAALDSALAADWNEAGIVYQSKAGIERTADTPDATTQSVIAAHYLHDPDWQPGGGRVVYQQRRGSRWEIFAVNPDGSANGVLTQPRTTLVDQLPSNVSPAWSPDGQHIVFLSNREANGEAGTWRLWVMNADGSNQRPLPINVPITYNFVQEQMVSWS
jgi:hypothetical protein